MEGLKNKCESLELRTALSLLLPFFFFLLLLGQRANECEMSEWSQWGSCTKKNKTCGFKKGSQSRVRVPLPHVHSLDTSPAFVPSQTCAPQTEKKKCVVVKTPCARGKQNHDRGNIHKTSSRKQKRCLIIKNISI